jgi:hypothetical protein
MIGVLMFLMFLIIFAGCLSVLVGFLDVFLVNVFVLSGVAFSFLSCLHVNKAKIVWSIASVILFVLSLNLITSFIGILLLNFVIGVVTGLLLYIFEG